MISWQVCYIPGVHTLMKTGCLNYFQGHTEDQLASPDVQGWH